MLDVDDIVDDSWIFYFCSVSRYLRNSTRSLSSARSSGTNSALSVICWSNSIVSSIMRKVSGRHKTERDHAFSLSLQPPPIPTESKQPPNLYLSRR